MQILTELAASRKLPKKYHQRLTAWKSSWWHRHLAGAANRLEACATKGGGHEGPPHQPFHFLYHFSIQKKQTISLIY
jgi:hypothetical protein